MKGSTQGSVTSALSRLELLAESSRMKLQFTHFVSIPFTSVAIQSQFELFQDAVLQANSTVGPVYWSILVYEIIWFIIYSLHPILHVPYETHQPSAHLHLSLAITFVNLFSRSKVKAFILYCYYLSSSISSMLVFFSLTPVTVIVTAAVTVIVAVAVTAIMVVIVRAFVTVAVTETVPVSVAVIVTVIVIAIADSS